VIDALPARAAVAAALLLGIGVTLLLSCIPWFSRQSLADRVRPYVMTAGSPTERAPVLSVASFREVLRPAAALAATSFARAVGVAEDLSVRLDRIHSRVDATAFRVRQAGFTAAGLGAGLAMAAVARTTPVVALVFAFGTPALVFLTIEHRLSTASAAWQRRILHELPVVAEQLGMLLTAGYSLGAALNRLAARGRGACGLDLRRVCTRIRHGVGEMEALREWAAVARVDALDRLVAVLALNRDAGDIGPLVAQAARDTRREVQRRLVETIERRAQQVWIPVTVATLVPGAIFLAVPFVDAMHQFAVR
jgi:tight adherence protein C